MPGPGVNVKEPLYHSGTPWATTVYPGVVVSHRVQPGIPWAGTTVRTSGCRCHGNRPTAPRVPDCLLAAENNLFDCGQAWSLKKKVKKKKMVVA